MENGAKVMAFDLLCDLMQLGDLDQITPTQKVALIYDEIVDARIIIELDKRIKELNND